MKYSLWLNQTLYFGMTKKLLPYIYKFVLMFTTSFSTLNQSTKNHHSIQEQEMVAQDTKRIFLFHRYNSCPPTTLFSQYKVRSKPPAALSPIPPTSP